MDFHLCTRKEKPDEYKVEFTSGKAKYYRKDGDIDTLTEIVVCAGENAEIRSITLANHGQESCVMEITSYLNRFCPTTVRILPIRPLETCLSGRSFGGT